MSDTVIVAAIGALAIVLAAAIPVLGTLLAKLDGRVKAVQEQVNNDHTNPDGSPLNLRDDLDEKHVENHGILLAIQRDIAWLMRRVAATDDRVDHLEDTARKQHPPEGETP